MDRAAFRILVLLALAPGTAGLACNLDEGSGTSPLDSGEDVGTPPPPDATPDGPLDALVEAAPDAPASFVPSDISGLALWLRADKGVIGGDGGAAVVSWLDQSGSGHDVAAPSVAAWPSLEPANAAYGGMPTVRFQDAAHRLQAPASWHQPQPYTILFVANAAGQMYLFDSNDTVNRASITVTSPAETVRLYTNSYGYQPPDGGPSIATPGVVVGVFAGPNSALYVNGVKAWSGELGNDQCWGATIGNYSGGGWPLQGSVAEVAIWSQALDAPSVAKLDAYAHDRYGFP